MGKSATGPSRRTQKSTDAPVDNDDLAIVPTCDFGYDIPSDFEDEEVDESTAFHCDDSDDADHDFLTSGVETADPDQIEKDLRREAKRTGSKLVDLSDLISDDDNEPPTVSRVAEQAGDEDAEHLSVDNDDDDGDDDADAHAAVLSVVEQLSRRDDARLRRQADHILRQQVDATVAPKLTLDALLDPLKATNAFASVKSTMERFTSDTKAKVADVPLESNDRRRLERSAGLKQARTEMDKWAHLVQANRQAEQLAFPLKQNRLSESSATLVANFKPTSSLEQDLKQLTQLYRRTEMDLLKTDPLDDGNSDAHGDALDRRQAQIAKMRSLLFYHELRAKRIKKIKSKAFRKHLKKAQAKVAGDEPDDQDEERQKEIREKRELERINARMSLRVKNTSKWMKAALRHGGLTDAEVKEQVADQQRNIEALRSRIQSLKDADDSNSSSDSDTDENAEVAQLAREIDSDLPQLRKGVYGLKFMVRAAEQQKAKAQELMREFERAAADSAAVTNDGNDECEGDDAAVAVVRGRKSFGPGMTIAPTSAAEPAQVKLMANSFQIEQVGFTSSGFRSAVSGHLQAPAPESDPLLDLTAVTTASLAAGDAAVISAARSSPAGSSGPPISDNNGGLSDLAATAPSSTTPRSKPRKQRKAKTNAGQIESTAENPWKHGNSAAKADVISSSTKLLEMTVADDNDEGDFSVVPAAASKEHRALVQAAFATAGDEVEGFIAEKQAIINEDLPEEPSSELPGWGSWAGAGLKPSRAAKRRAANQAAEHAARKKAAIDRRKDGSMSHVIINEKHDKKLQKYRLKSVPFPYTSAEHYERSLQIPLGTEWHSQSAHTDLIQPAVKCKMGHIIDPITYSKPLKRQSKK